MQENWRIYEITIRSEYHEDGAFVEIMRSIPAGVISYQSIQNTEMK